VTITKKWLHHKYWDVTGTSAGTGSVSFALGLWIDDNTDDETFAPGSFSVPLVAGEFLVALRINDDGQDNPTNTAWSITETVNGSGRTRIVQILSSNPHGDSEGDPIELVDLMDVVADPDYGSYASAASVSALEAALADLEARVTALENP
jgi:hypothetical protein